MVDDNDVGLLGSHLGDVTWTAFSGAGFVGADGVFAVHASPGHAFPWRAHHQFRHVAGVGVRQPQQNAGEHHHVVGVAGTVVAHLFEEAGAE